MVSTSWLARVGVGVLAAGLVLSGFTAPALAQDPPPGGEPPDPGLAPVECPEFEGEPAAADEFTAYQYALACGVDVEVLELRDLDRQVFATPAGLLQAQIAAEPYWVPDQTGAWVDIDPTLVGQADGSAITTATVIDLIVGGGGTDPFVTAADPDGGSLRFTWPGGGLPAPVLDGAVATYPEVLPGVDLAVQAEPVGFSWVLVVKTPEAAADPALSQISIGIDAVGLEVIEDPETGGIEVVDGSGAVIFEAGQAIMWDSSVAGGEGAPATEALSPPSLVPSPSSRSTESAEDGPPADPGVIGEVEVELTGDGVELTPDPAMLADQSLTYPLYIDPPFTSTRKAWANVYSGAKSRGWTGDSSWPRAGGMRVGNNTWSNCGDGCGLWRSAITLNIGKLNGRYIHSASVRALQTHTGGCGSYGLQLWRTNAISNGVSWNGVNWLYGSQLQTRSVPSSNKTGCGSGNTNEWVSFDGGNVKKRVQSAADQRYDTISFGFRSSSESDRNAWRRIRTSSVALHVEYYLYPPKPDRLALNGDECRTSQATARWVTSRNPTMSARARSQESESVYVRLRVRELGADSNFFYYRTPAPMGTHSTVNRRITTALPDGHYNWQARADARQTAAVNSGYTDLCYFKVDATKPTPPTLPPPAAEPFIEGQNVRLPVSASDPLVNGVRSGLARFEYSWQTPTYDQSVASSGTATITLPDASAGRHVLYVRSVDHAGNTSNERTHTFFVGRDIPATAMAAWRLGGDLVDDTGHDNPLTLSSGTGPVFAIDPSDPDNLVLELDGSTCMTANAPIRTDGAFSLSLNVRLDAASGHTKLLTQGNEHHSAFQIQHNAADNKWSFSLLSAPGPDFTWRSVSAVSPVPRGEWLAIGATYDPDAGVQRLFFDGAVVAEQAVDFEPWNGTDTFSLGCLRTAAGNHGHFFTGAVELVGLWEGLRRGSQMRGNDLLPYAETARWELRGDGSDASDFGNQLHLPDSAVHAFDPFGRPDGALVLDGQSCATTGSALAPRDTTFGISAWLKPVRLKDGNQVLFGQVDDAGNGFVVIIDEEGLLKAGPPAVLGIDGAGTASSPADPPIRPMSVVDDVPAKAGWQRVMISYQRDDNWFVQIDRVGSGTESVGVPGFADAPLTVGCVDFGQGGQNHFEGMLHDVRFWRGNRNFNNDDPWHRDHPSELQGRWRLAGHGTDTSGHGRDLSFEGATQFNDGRTCDPDGALELAGGHAASAAPVLATDESFTVSAWVRLDTLTDSATVVSAAGQQNTGFRLQYGADQQRFQFVMTSGDEASSTPGFQWHVARGGPAPEADTWYHLVGIYDLYQNELHLYVSGQLVATADGPESPWYADGPLLLGASGTIDLDRWDLLRGAVDEVAVWHGTVPDRIIGQISAAPIPKC